MEFIRASLVSMGFHGFTSIGRLKSDGYNEIPPTPGIYVVLRQSLGTGAFLLVSIGGHFKGKDPSVSIAELQENWVADAHVLYIGKAGGSASAATLASRIRQYIEFGKGKPIGHWGGRYIWQLADSDSLLVAWKELSRDEPRAVEQSLIEGFELRYGRMPFANLAR